MALPSEITDVIRIAAGDEVACEMAATATGETRKTLIEAARLFVKQVLFRPDADCFRVLGVSPGAPKSLARYHMRTLLAWLHPDRNRDGDSVFAHRVLLAWSEFSKIPRERLAVKSATAARQSRGRRARLPIIRLDNASAQRRRRRVWPYLLLGAISLCVFAAVVFPDKIWAIAETIPFKE
jgi:hypothetical protein